MILLRSIAFQIWFVGLTTAMALASVAVRLAAPSRTHDYGRLWTRLVLVGLRRICGITLRAEGFEMLPREGPLLIASEHQSTFETMAWMTLVPKTTYVLKRELMWIPLVGGMLRVTGQIPVRRGGGAPAMLDMLRRAETAAGERRSIVIFPQGTRTAPGARVRLRGGVAALSAHLGLPVWPVSTDAGEHWPRRRLRKFPGVVTMRVGPALPAGMDREALLAAVAASWEALHEGAAVPVDKPVHEAVGDV
jgi:1-acyl-sn-glycerol-3-phosphate acyltransferase